MFLHAKQTVRVHSVRSTQSIGMPGFRTVLASLSAAFVLNACGGGDLYATVPVPVNFNIGVTVGDRYVNTTPVVAGGSLDIAIHAGQHLRLDAGEPVVWTFFVGGSAISGGAQVYYAGADITAYTLSASAMGLDTYASYPLQAPVAVTFIARSTYDSVQVATINLLITN